MWSVLHHKMSEPIKVLSCLKEYTDADPVTRVRRSATFLPEVAASEDWSHSETMEHLIAKSGHLGRYEDVLTILEVSNWENPHDSLQDMDLHRADVNCWCIQISNEWKPFYQATCMFYGYLSVLTTLLWLSVTLWGETCLSSNCTIFDYKRSFVQVTRYQSSAASMTYSEYYSLRFGRGREVETDTNTVIAVPA